MCTVNKLLIICTADHSSDNSLLETDDERNESASVPLHASGTSIKIHVRILVDVKVNLVNKKMYYGCSINILLGLHEKLSSTGLTLICCSAGFSVLCSFHHLLGDVLAVIVYFCFVELCRYRTLKKNQSKNYYLYRKCLIEIVKTLYLSVPFICVMHSII